MIPSVRGPARIKPAPMEPLTPAWVLSDLLGFLVFVVPFWLRQRKRRAS